MHSSLPMDYPNIEELRMLRAIGVLALMEAAIHGGYRATFRGFRVRAWRTGPESKGYVQRVRLEVCVGAELMASTVTDVAVRADVWQTIA